MESTQVLRLTKEELRIIREVSLYYRDIATHDESGIAGLSRDSKEFKLICSVMGKIGHRQLFWDTIEKRRGNKE